MPGAQTLAQRRGQAPREPAVALGPGQHRFAFAVLGTRRLEAMAAREVMDAGPRRRHVDARAVVVATAVVQVPAQLRVEQSLAIEPGRERHPVELALRGGRHRGDGDREAGELARPLDEQRELPILAQRAGVHALQRQQPFLPLAVEVEPLLRAVAQVALVVNPAARLALP